MGKRRRNIRTVIAPDTAKGMREWKIAVSQRIWKFVKDNFQSKHKVGGHYLWIDSDSLVNSLILTGYAYPAAEMKGFGAPVGKRTGTRRHAFYTSEFGWRMTETRALTGSLGVWQRPTEYYGGRHIDSSLGYFGVVQDGEVRAFGLDSEGALPVYSYDVCTWLDEQAGEVHRILDDTFLEVFSSERQTA